MAPRRRRSRRAPRPARPDTEPGSRSVLCTSSRRWPRSAVASHSRWLSPTLTGSEGSSSRERPYPATNGRRNSRSTTQPRKPRSSPATSTSERPQRRLLAADRARLGTRRDPGAAATRIRRPGADESDVPLQPDLATRLLENRVPALVLVGASDKGDFRAIAERLAGELPNARLVVIPSATHLPSLEQPEAFEAAVRPFLETIG